MSRTNDRTTRSLELAHAIAELITPALTGIEQAQAGWPTQTPGAAAADAPIVAECPMPNCTNTRPCLDHDGDLDTDRATDDHGKLDAHLRHAVSALAKAAAIVTFWGMPGISKTATAERLKAIAADVWCTNCRSHDINEPRAAQGTVCTYCRDFSSSWGEYPPFEILDAKARRRLSEQDIKRTLRMVHDRDAEAAKHVAKQKAKGTA